MLGALGLQLVVRDVNDLGIHVAFCQHVPNMFDDDFVLQVSHAACCHMFYYHGKSQRSRPASDLAKSDSSPS